MHLFYFPEFNKDSPRAMDKREPMPAYDEKDSEFNRQCSNQVGVEDELDTREIELECLNEKYFLKVFKALLFTKNVRILYRLVDVVNFYILHRTPL